MQIPPCFHPLQEETAGGANSPGAIKVLKKKRLQQGTTSQTSETENSIKNRVEI